MLHEIILSLLCPDAQFLEEQNEALKLNLFLHPSEKCLLRRILSVAKDFATIKKFSEYVNGKVDGNDDGKSYGMYLKAFTHGVEKELIPYHRDIIDLQEKALLNPSMTISELQCFITKHYNPLKSYCALINQIENRQLRGGQLLQLIYENSTTGDEEIVQSLNRLLQECHVAFFKQLSSWLFYGQVHDRYKEFFIQPLESVETEKTITVAASPKIPVDTIAAFQFFIEFNAASNIRKHQIESTLVPSYISYSLAQKILFLGETILMVTSKHSNASNKFVNSIYNGKEKKYMQEIIEFETKVCLKPYALEKILDEMRSSVMEYLWKLAITECYLYEQVKLIKDFYLLSHGELFTEFLRKSDGILYKPLTTSSVRILNYSLQQAALSVGTIKESSLDKFEFTMPEEIIKEGGNIFNCLKLTYKTEWPLQLFFTAEVLHNYNVLFLFLLRIKKIQMDLHGLWLKNVKQKQMKCWKEAWQLRTGLMFLIDNLQYYLQVDVLETEFSALMKAANETKDFEKLQQLHLLFLSKILTHSFVSHVQWPPKKLSSKNDGHMEKSSETRPHPVNACLTKIFKICEKFISVMASDKSLSADNELPLLLEFFHQQLSVLIISMSELTSRNISYKHLNQFLLRLDFNNWFTNKFDLTKYI
ncbi:unnamed protein product [Bemisia tabaci]|uniref:Gamma-tubulin complex component n=2 Tax=Bemisia tabaci TaxID=7038 RepID=A0A9P0F6Z6_BEMTA|nr:unnamed protein product [Bemisia tabaci]